MASGWMTINTLKISRLFLTTPQKKRYCCGIADELHMPEQSVRDQLRAMRDKDWLESEQERIDRSLVVRQSRVLYRITEHGMAAAAAALGEVQWSGTIMLSS
jgi:predicted transcriptional regulator